MSNFIDSLIEHTKDYESPTSFWRWAAIVTIAATIRDNVYLEDGDTELYPNLYVLFLAGSAERKARPVTLSEQLVAAVRNTKIISGRASIQAILADLGHAETDKNTGEVIRAGSAIFYAPELSAGLVDDTQAIQILTDIYDHKPSGHTTKLITRTTAKSDKLIFNMLAASNADLLKNIYDRRAIYGGLLSRTQLIVPSEWRPANPWPKKDTKGFKALVEELRGISKLQGSIKVPEKPYKFYSDWYSEYREKLRGKPDHAGVMGRMGTNVKKLAAILCANDLSLELTVKHIEDAISLAMGIIPNYNTFVYATTVGTVEGTSAFIIQDLLDAKDYCLTHQKILEKHWSDFSLDMLGKAVSTLTMAGLIRDDFDAARGGQFLTLTKTCLERMGVKEK